MPRSLKKGPFIDAHLFAKVEKAIESNSRNIFAYGPLELQT